MNERPTAEMERASDEDKRRYAERIAAMEAKHGGASAPAMAAAAPEGPDDNDASGGQTLAMNVEDSNALRAKLGLKPLEQGSAPSKVRSPRPQCHCAQWDYTALKQHGSPGTVR